jgi:ferredoxin--NADP+ reductase
MEHSGHHFIAIIGGSVSGSEAALQLAERGFRVVVFDQLALPYGKIEDGLPKWHAKLRDKEERAIDEKLMHPNVRFVPLAQLGKSLDFDDLVRNWGFSAVLLAIGAWKDRPLPIPGLMKFTGKGLICQNELIKWYNHCHEPGYGQKNYKLVDGAAVIGGGLASIDVIKIIMIRTVQEKLAERGIIVDLFTMERGIDRILKQHNLTLQDLGMKGATLFYRRTSYDMPLKPYSGEEEREKARHIANKLLSISQKRYLFNFEPLSIPVGYAEKDGQLAGMVFQKAEIVEGRVKPIQGSEFTFKTNLVVSSIGSLPETIKGVPMKNDLISTSAFDKCQIDGFDHVFAIGNAVTGRGNISESKTHAKESAAAILEEHLEWDEIQFNDFLRDLESDVDGQVSAITTRLSSIEPMPDAVIRQILDRTADMQKKVGYSDYQSWKAKHLPVRLEDLPGRLDPYLASMQ